MNQKIDEPTIIFSELLVSSSGVEVSVAEIFEEDKPLSEVQIAQTINLEE